MRSHRWQVAETVREAPEKLGPCLGMSGESPLGRQPLEGGLANPGEQGGQGERPLVCSGRVAAWTLLDCQFQTPLGLWEGQDSDC